LSLRILFFIIFIFFPSCSKISFYYPTKLISNQTFYGKIWWKLSFYKENNVQTFGGYADFEISIDYLYIKLKSPFGSTIGLIEWKKDFPREIIFYNLKEKKSFCFTFNTPLSLFEYLNLYFLGIKNKKAIWYIKKNKFIYSFSFPEKKGKIRSSKFYLEWKIKKIFKTNKQNLKFLAFSFKDFEPVKILLFDQFD